MDIISESIDPAAQFFLVRPQINNLTPLKYKLFDPNSAETEVKLSFSDEEL